MKVSRRAAELRAAGRDIVDFSAGQPDFPSPPALVDAASTALRAGHTRYTAAAGLPDLRDRLAERYAHDYGAPWTSAQTVITVGAKAGLYEVFQCTVDEGDDVVLPTPAWVSFEEQVRQAGGTPITVPTSVDDGFTLHAAPLIAAIGERTRVVLVNSPCNPTGGTIDATELRLLAEACAERDVLLLCDETYEHFVWQGEHASGAALAADFPDTVAVIGSFSKTWSMTGWRLGWLLGPSALTRKVIDLQSHLTSNPTSFAMHGVLGAFDAMDTVQRMSDEFRARREIVVAALEAMPGVHCQPPAGAFYVFPDVSATYRDGRRGSLELAESLLEDAEVAVVPGLAFGADDHIRISFACSREQLAKGLERLGEALG
ncbi:MAG: pyridoxal phosphate-dependent aminotransferase [Acidobacteriota bacterium]